MLTTLYRQTGEHESCLYFVHETPFSEEEFEKILWLVRETYEPERVFTSTFYNTTPVVEVGPHISVETPFSSNAVSIARAMGLDKIRRIEMSRRFPLNGKPGSQTPEQ